MLTNAARRGEEEKGKCFPVKLTVLEKSAGFSKLEISFYVFLAKNKFVNALIPLKGVLKKVPVRYGPGQYDPIAFPGE